MRCAPEVKALHTISAVSRPWQFLQFLGFRDFCSFSTVTNCIEIVWRTPRHASIRLNSVRTNTKWNRGHIIYWVFCKRPHSQSGEKLIIGDRGKWKILLSMCVHQLVEKRKYSSYCNEGVNLADVINGSVGSLFSLQECQIKCCKTKESTSH